MAKFTDCEGTDWVFRIGVYEINEIRERTGIQLITETEDEQENSIEKIYDNPETLLDILWVCVRDQAEERDMSEDDVKKRFSYGPLNKQVRAWRQAVNEFVEGPDSSTEEGRAEGNESG